MAKKQNKANLFQFTVYLKQDGNVEMNMDAIPPDMFESTINKGMPVGKLRVTLPGLDTQEIDLVTTANIEREGMLARALSAISYVIFGE